MPRASFHRLAEREILDAAEFYEMQSLGLGAAFLEAAEECVARILANPSAGPRVRGQIRRRLLRRFPYGLLYRHREDGIRILAVMNLRRRPLYWVGRR